MSVYRGINISPWYEVLVDARPPRRGEGIHWVDKKKKIKLFGGWKATVITGDLCIGTVRGVRNGEYTPEQMDQALDDAKRFLDNLINRTMGIFGCPQKKAVIALKELEKFGEIRSL